MPQSLESLPPPAVEWRKESDIERQIRLQRSGVLPTPDAVAPASTQNNTVIPPNAAWAPQRLVVEAKKHKDTTKKSYIYWWGVDLARWSALRSPRDTRTVTDGSFGLQIELTHPGWKVGDSQLGLGPKAIFYHGGQFAKMASSPVGGNGYAKFAASELGLFASFTGRADETQSDWRGFWSTNVYYLPIRWVRAESTSYGETISRSDTRTKTAISLPGLGVQIGVGFDWNALAKVEVFAAVQGAWPLQLRLRTGLQASMALATPSLPFVGPN